jgi:hypothetical protein
MVPNPQGRLKNHQEFTGKIGKRGSGRRQYFCNIRNWCNIPDTAALFRHTEEDTIRIVRWMRLHATLSAWENIRRRRANPPPKVPTWRISVPLSSLVLYLWPNRQGILSTYTTAGIALRILSLGALPLGRYLRQASGSHFGEILLRVPGIKLPPWIKLIAIRSSVTDCGTHVGKVHRSAT